MMNEIEKQILDTYVAESNIWEMSYKVLWGLMDEKYVAERLELYKISEAYLYASTYMAVQLYRIGKGHMSVKGVVDTAGNAVSDDITDVLTLDELKDKYNGETIIITSIRRYMEIKTELEKFVDREKIIYICELMFGIG